MHLIPYILNGIKRIRLRLWVNEILKYSILGGSIGFLISFMISFISIWVPISNAVGYGIFFGLLGLVAGIFYSLFHLPSLKRAALIGDSKGLQESLTTALEMKGSKDAISQLQREQTASLLKSFDYQKQIPLIVPWRSSCVLAFAVICFFICTSVPSQAKNIAFMRKELKEAVEAQKEEIEKVKEEVLKENDLGEIQKENLEKLLDMALEELNRLEAQEGIDKVMERLDTKLEKEKQLQDDPQFTQMAENVSEKLKLPSEEKRAEIKEELEKALEEEIRAELENSESQLTEKQMEELAKKMAQEFSEGNGEADNEALAGLSEISGLSQEQLDEVLQNASISMEKKSESQQMAGQQSQIGKEGQAGQEGGPSQSGQTGQEGGQGQSGQTGQGEGQGENGRSGNGTGWNQGDKYGFEKANDFKASPEKLNIPERMLGGDENITGSPADGNTYFVQSESGLAWSGQKMDYNQVIGEYKNEAYHKISQSSVPDPVKDIVKDYFSGLSE